MFDQFRSPASSNGGNGHARLGSTGSNQLEFIVRINRVIVVFAVGAVALTACGSDTKTIKTDDGKITVSGSGKNAKVTINSEKGSTTFNQSKVPNGFPSDVPIPKGLTLKTASSGPEPSGTGRFFSLGYELGKKSPSDVVDAYKSQLDNAGFTTADTGSIGGSTATIKNLNATGKGWNITATALGVTGHTIFTVTVLTAG